MKTSAKIGGVVAAVMLAVSGAAFAADAVNPYVQANGTTLKSGYGLCWRTGFWTPALATAAPRFGFSLFSTIFPASAFKHCRLFPISP